MKDRIYLDNAASTPVDPRVFEAMEPYFSSRFGNPGSVHLYGQEVMRALDKSRESIAALIGAKFNEIIFTSSATEANNIALRGIAQRGKRIIVSAVEHESVLETAKDLENKGVEVVYVPVNRSGLIDLKKLERAIDKNTVLVSVMYANNEIGTIQPISEIAKIIRKFKESNIRGQMSKVLLHTDAVQAFNYLDCNVDNIHVDLMTLSSHKIYGPKGVGCLYIRNLENSKIEPLLTGGGQEFGLRSSTENIPAIVGFAKAAEITAVLRTKEAKRLKDLRNYFWREIIKVCKKAEINGSIDNRLPNNLNIYFPGVKAEELLIKLDLSGIAVSSGSACASRSLEPSYVIQALGFTRERAEASIRLTLGRYVTKKDIDRTASQLKILIK